MQREQQGTEVDYISQPSLQVGRDHVVHSGQETISDLSKPLGHDMPLHLSLPCQYFSSMATRWQMFYPSWSEQEIKLDHVKLLILGVYLSLQHGLA